MTLANPYYFVGIGGSGMAPLAEILLRHGHQVAGADLQQNSITESLSHLGASVYNQHSSQNLPPNATLVRSSAVPAHNPEVAFATEQGLPVLHRSDLLAKLMAHKKAITIAGTHGKTTTSAMLTWTLEQLDQDPTAIIGGVMCHSGSSCRYGHTDLFVAEADESDGSFLKYNPTIAVITNIDSDHLDHYGSFDNILTAFKTHSQNIQKQGCLVLNAEDPSCLTLQKTSGHQSLTFGWSSSADVWGDLKTLQTIDGKTIIRIHKGAEAYLCQLPTIGRHNILNAMATLCVTTHLSLDFIKACQALEHFPGTKRRLNLVVKNENVIVFDDYAHNPGKIQAAIQGLRQAWPNHHFHVIFQPHRYTRTQSLWNEFARSFQNADSVHITPIYAASETSLPNITHTSLAEAVAHASQVNTVPLCNLDNLSSAVLKIAKQQTKPFLCLTVGAGDLTKLSVPLGNALQGALK